MAPASTLDEPKTRFELINRIEADIKMLKRELKLLIEADNRDWIKERESKQESVQHGRK